MTKISVDKLAILHKIVSQQLVFSEPALPSISTDVKKKKKKSDLRVIINNQYKQQKGKKYLKRKRTYYFGEREKI